MQSAKQRSVTLRDVEEEIQYDLAERNYSTNREDLLDRLVAVKQARALELISLNLRDIRDTLQGNTYKG